MSVIKKELDQSIYIIQKLTQRTNKLSINKVSTSKIGFIVENAFNNAIHMLTGISMFDNMFLTTSKSKKDGMFYMSHRTQSWVKQIKQLAIESMYGYVYLSDIFSQIKVIIKLPQKKDGRMEMIREYFIGITSINKLRYIVPNFVFTFASFICPFDNKIICNGTDESSIIPFVIFENIPGENMGKMLIKNELTFTQYLGMFIQVLIALEVAQREISFTHFDFHTENLMCRKISEEYKYTVPLDNIVYEICASEYLPVIIDFGLSTVKQDNIVIGSYKLPEHGMMNFMLPGVDMYKFLFYSYSYSNTVNLEEQILNLMSFYGKHDPYNLINGGSDAFIKAREEYVRECSFSRVATYTPLEFLNWILEQPEYSDIVSIYVKKKERNVYIPLSSLTYESKFNIKNLLYLRKNSEPSYILSNYYIHILSNYKKNLFDDKYINLSSVNKKKLSDELDIHIQKMTNNIKKFRVKLIKTDFNILMEYKNLSIPNIMKIQDDSKRILNIKIDSKPINKHEILINRYLKNVSFFTEILPYLQFLYTIKEIKLKKVYTKFLLSFTSSDQYKMYNNYHISVIKTSRWCNSLKDFFMFGTQITEYD